MENPNVNTSYAGSEQVTSNNHPTHELVVFQCEKCKNIIGDSSAWVTATPSLRTISLSSMTFDDLPFPPIVLANSFKRLTAFIYFFLHFLTFIRNDKIHNNSVNQKHSYSEHEKYIIRPT